MSIKTNSQIKTNNDNSAQGIGRESRGEEKGDREKGKVYYSLGEPAPRLDTVFARNPWRCEVIIFFNLRDF